jgi:hypothetical protein
MTTFASYGQVDMRRQAEIIRELERPKVSQADAAEMLKQVQELVGRVSA